MHTLFCLPLQISVSSVSVSPLVSGMKRNTAAQLAYVMNPWHTNIVCIPYSVSNAGNVLRAAKEEKSLK